MPWNFRKFGSPTQLIHKSDLNDLSGPFACQRRFRYARDARIDGAYDERANVIRAETPLGTATHETIARVLNNTQVLANVMQGLPPSAERIRVAIIQELQLASEGCELDWRDADPNELIDERMTMVEGLLRSLPKYVHSVVACELGFAVALDSMHFGGHIDLVFRPRDAPNTLALADWKTGKSKPDPIELQHGWESGLYSLALHDGMFTRALKRDECNGMSSRDALEAKLERMAEGEHFAEHDVFKFGEFPSAIYHVHLRDFLPYKRGGSRNINRADELAHYGLDRPSTIRYKAGDTRGPGWLRVERNANDIPRLAHRVRTVIGNVRLGRFLDTVDERCGRCAFKVDCLTGGYAARGDELAELQARLKAAGI